MKTVLVTLATLGLAGCAAQPDHLREARDYDEQDRINRFGDFQAACLRRNGVLVVNDAGGRLRNKIVPHRTARYSCQPRQDFRRGFLF